MIEFTIEPGYDKFWAEAEHLIVAHWNEVGNHRDVLTLNPRHEVYRALEVRGELDIIMAREDGVLKGYFFLLYTQHPRDVSVKMAMDDIMYLTPSARKNWAGYKMIKFALERAEAQGARIASFT